MLCRGNHQSFLLSIHTLPWTSVSVFRIASYQLFLSDIIMQPQPLSDPQKISPMALDTLSYKILSLCVVPHRAWTHMICQTAVSALFPPKDTSILYLSFPPTHTEYLMCKTKPWQTELINFTLLCPLPVFCLLFSFASEHLSFFTTGVALDEAAPLEFAVTLPHTCVLVCVMTAAAAHEVAAIWVGWGVVAEAASRPCTARQRVLLAVVRGAFQIHQVRVSGLDVAVWLLEAQEGRLA